MTLLEGDPDPDCVEMILEKMELRTCQQGTVDWFLDQQLSMTSSTASSLALSVAAITTEDDSIHASFKIVLDYAGCVDILGSSVVEPEPEPVMHQRGYQTMPTLSQTPSLIKP